MASIEDTVSVCVCIAHCAIDATDLMDAVDAVDAVDAMDPMDPSDNGMKGQCALFWHCKAVLLSNGLQWRPVWVSKPTRAEQSRQRVERNGATCCNLAATFSLRRHSQRDHNNANNSL